MKKRGSPAGTIGRPEEARSGALPSIEQCKRVERGVRRHLLRVEDEVRTAQDRLSAEVQRQGPDARLAVSASATVIVSVAAALMEVVSQRAGAAFDEAEFVNAARAAAEVMQERAARKAKRKGG